MITFLHLSLRNFGSWDRLDLDLTQRGLVCIQGDSGAGKSTVVKALFWCLFGTTPDPSRADEIMRGKKTARVRLKMKRDDDVYIITRYRNHPVYKNKVHFQGRGIPNVDEDSLVRTVQGLINNFLHTSEQVFLTTTFFAQRNFHCFHNLSDTAKKEYLESLTYGSIFSLCEQEARNRTRQLEHDIAFIQGKVSSITQDIATLKTYSDTQRRDMKTRLKQCCKKIKRLRRKLAIYEKKERLYVQLSSAYDLEKRALTQHQSRLGSLKQEIRSFESNQQIRCPECGAMLSVLQRQQRSEALSLALTKEDDAIKRVQRRMAVLEGKRKPLEGVVNKVTAVQRIIQELELDRRRLQDSLSQGDMRIDLLMNTLVKVERTLKCQQHRLQLVRFWVRGFGFQGLRSMILFKAIRYLEERIRFYLHFVTRESLNFSLTFEGNRILASVNGRSYYALSGGERQIVDLSTGLALRDLAERYNKSQFNILILDEPMEGLDGHLTAVAQDLLLTHAKPTTLLITHQAFPRSFATSLLEVRKRNKTSTLRKIY